MCITWEVSCLKALLLLLDCSSFFFAPLHSLISNCLNLSLGTHGKSLWAVWGPFPKNKKLGTQRLLCPGAPQGLGFKVLALCSWLLLLVLKWSKLPKYSPHPFFLAIFPCSPKYVQLICVCSFANYSKIMSKLTWLLPNLNSGAKCTVKPNQPKSQSLEQRNVYWRAKQGQ